MKPEIGQAANFSRTDCVITNDGRLEAIETSIWVHESSRSFHVITNDGRLEAIETCGSQAGTSQARACDHERRPQRSALLAVESLKDLVTLPRMLGEDRCEIVDFDRHDD